MNSMSSFMKNQGENERERERENFKSDHQIHTKNETLGGDGCVN